MTTFDWREPNRAPGESGSAMARGARLERDELVVACDEQWRWTCRVGPFLVLGPVEP